MSFAARTGTPITEQGVMTKVKTNHVQIDCCVQLKPDAIRHSFGCWALEGAKAILICGLWYCMTGDNTHSGGDQGYFLRLRASGYKSAPGYKRSVAAAISRQCVLFSFTALSGIWTLNTQPS